MWTRITFNIGSEISECWFLVICRPVFRSLFGASAYSELFKTCLAPQKKRYFTFYVCATWFRPLKKALRPETCLAWRLYIFMWNHCWHPVIIVRAIPIGCCIWHFYFLCMYVVFNFDLVHRAINIYLMWFSGWVCFPFVESKRIFHT